MHKISLKRLRSFFALLPLLFFLQSGAAHALNIDNVRFGVHSDKTRLVFELDRPAKYRVFVLSSPYRLVIDMPDFEWRAGSVSKPPTAAVKNVRQGRLKPGISRVVFDLERPVVIRSAFTIGRTGSRPDRLVIDYAPANVETFLSNKGRQFGNLGQAAAQGAVQKAAAPSNAPKPPPAAARKTSDKKPLIVIDPGHGGIDPGAVGANGVHEKDVALSAAKELKRQLLATGRYRVKMTRETDVYLKLGERVRIARNYEADLFMSIHADSIRNSKVRGASIYTLSEKASDTQTARLAERENRADLIGGIDLSVEDDEVAKILVDLSMRETMNQSKFFANTVVSSMSGSGIRLLQNPHRYAGFAVLKAPDIPSVLVEIGFMSNRSEANLLTRPEHKRKIARSLMKGIDSYFERVRRHERT